MIDTQMFIESQWGRLDLEVEGSTPDLCWLVNQNNGDIALFKPDTLSGEEAWREYCCYKIAKYLGIACAKVETGHFGGKRGCLSYFPDGFRRYLVCDGYSLYRCGNLFNNSLSDSEGVVHNYNIALSFGSLRELVTKEVEMELVDMMYLDCLVKNPDRHPGNYSFAINYAHAICALLPLYDHGLCLRKDLRDISMFPYEGVQDMSFSAIYHQLKREYRQKLLGFEELISSDEFERLLGSLGCRDFIMSRCASLIGFKPMLLF